MANRKKARMSAQERLKRLKRSFGVLKDEPLDYGEIKKSRRDHYPI